MSHDMYRQTYLADGPPPYHPSTLKQWATKILSYSSQYNNCGWSATQALGPPKVYPQHGDIQGAWASSVYDKHQFIEIEFEVPVRPTAINIYETFNPGAVVAVKFRNSIGKWAALWKTDRPKHLTGSRIFSPTIPEIISTLPISQIRIEVDCTAANTWCEIDAVELVGVREGAVAPVDDSQFIADLDVLVNNKLYSDVKFQIDGKEVYAHKAILAARSPYFAKMFDENNDDHATLKMPDVTFAEIFCVLRFLYTNRLPADCTAKSLVKVCSASAVFEVPELRTAALYKLVETMDCNSVVDVFLKVEKDPEAGDIRSLCVKFMSSRLKEMSHVPAFEALPQTIIVQIVQEATAGLNVNN